MVQLIHTMALSQLKSGGCGPTVLPGVKYENLQAKRVNVHEYGRCKGACVTNMECITLNHNCLAILSQPCIYLSEF